MKARPTVDEYDVGLHLRLDGVDEFPNAISES